MVNFRLLAAQIVSFVWDTPANFNGFHVLASLLQWSRSAEASQTFHKVWPLPGLVDYIFGGCCSVTEFCCVRNSLCVLQILRSPIGSVTARQSSSGREPNFAALSTGRHLYSTGRPWRSALAHILVLLFLLPVWWVKMYKLNIMTLDAFEARFNDSSQIPRTKSHWSYACKLIWRAILPSAMLPTRRAFTISFYFDHTAK